MSPKKPRELKVVFDTSVLYTGSASDLLNNDSVTIIQNNSDHDDLKIEWYLPEVVIHERKYQMRAQGIKFIPPVKKLERLLGHNLNITEDVIKSRIEKVVEEQISILHIHPIYLDYS